MSNNNSKDKVIIFYDGEHEKSLLKDYVSNTNQSQFDYITSYDLDEVSNLIEELPKAVLLFEVFDKMSLAKVYKILKDKNKYIRNNNLKVSGFNHSNNPQIVKALNKLGVTEILDHELKPKTISFKIQFWEKSLKEKVVSESSVDSGLPINFIPALEIPESIWIIASKNEIKKVLRNYLIKIYGPSSGVGGWTQYIEDGRINRNKWSWKFKDPEDVLAYSEGEWIFKGAKPEFDHKLRRWIFSGQDISLVFKKGEEELTYFTINQGGNLEITENSRAALEKKEFIKDTHENQHIKSIDSKNKKDEDELDKSFSNSDDSNKQDQRDDSVSFSVDEVEDSLNGSFSSDKIEGNLKGKIGKAQLVEDKKNRVGAENLGSAFLKGKVTDSNVDKKKKNDKTGNVIEVDFNKDSDITLDEPSDGSFEDIGIEIQDKAGSLKGHVSKQEDQKENNKQFEIDNNIFEIVEKIDKEKESEEVVKMVDSGEFMFEATLRVKDDNSNEGIIIDFFEDNLDFISEDGEYTEGDEINLRVIYKYNKEEVEIETKGEVLYAEDNLVTVKLIDFPQQLLADMLKLFEERQDNIDNFMKLAKGY